MKRIKDKINYFSRDLIRAATMLWQADKRLMLLNIAVQIVMAMLPALSLYVIKLLIETVVAGGEDHTQVIWLIAAFGGIQFLLALSSQYATYVSTLHQQKLSDHLSGTVLKKAVEVDYEYYENPAYHDTLHLAQQQSLHRAVALLGNFNSVLLNSMSIVFLAALFLTMQSVFALLFIVLFIPVAVIKWYSGYELLKLERKFVPMEREASYLHQVLTGVNFAKEVRILGFGNSFITKFRQIRSGIHSGKRKLHLKFMRYSLAAEAFEIIAMAFIFGWIAISVWDKTISVGSFVVYIQGFQRLQSTSKGFLQSLVQLFQQRLFLSDLFSFFDIENKNPARSNIPFPTGGSGLSVENISFSYPQTNKPVLHGITIKCQPGQIVAIVGENGSGKSTLVKILARLYPLESGKVSINDIDLTQIDMDSFRDHITFMFQDFEKYFLTIEENISLGGLQAGRSEDIKRAAALSGADPFITRLSSGYATRMGRLFTGSEQLSGGQWQKLILSRIFYRSSRLLILDEPTSALDAGAELELYKNLKEFAKDKMIILISHRLYNLKLADQIYVMSEGEIVESGSFEKLVNSKGAFRGMYEAQKL